MPKHPFLSAILSVALLATVRADAAEANAAAPKAPPEEDLTLFPIPNYKGDFWTRDAMLGDLGFRTALAQHGIQLEVDLNQIYQGVVAGGRPGRSTNWEYSGSADYVLKLDTGKAGLWPGGFLTIHGKTFYGDPTSLATGSLLPTNTDFALSDPHGEGTYLPHVYFTQFLTEKLAISFGKLDTTVGDDNAFAHGTGVEGFMNLGFCFNPVTLLTSPYSTLGAGLMYLPNDKVTLGFSVFDTDGDIRDAGFDTLFKGATTFAGDIAVKTRFFDHPGTQRLAVMVSSGDFTSLRQDPRVLEPDLGVTPVSRSSTWAIAYNFDQYLTENWGIFGRVGVSDGKANIFQTFYSIGVGGKGIIPGRDNDRFGVGLYYAGIADSLVSPLLNKSERGLEIFYDVAVTPWFSVTADVQVTSPVLKSADTATVLGLRGRIRF